MIVSAPPAARHARIRFGHLWIDCVSFARALDAIEELVQSGHGGAVFTANVDHVVTAQSHRAFRDAYASASLSLADGQPLVWASRLLGTPLPERVAGADLLEPLMRRAGVRGWRVFLVGGAAGAATKAAARFTSEYQVAIAGVEDGRIEVDETPRETALLDRITRSRPHLVLVALGAPKQELWIHARRARLAPAVALGVGASLDFAAGLARRAPPLLRRAGLEWLYRLAHEPRRLARRYLWNDPRFLAVLVRVALSPRKTRLLERESWPSDPA